RWYLFRSERLRAVMLQWLEAHHIEPVERTVWPVPTEAEVSREAQTSDEGRGSRVDVVDDTRTRLRNLVEVVPSHQLDSALAFLEFLCARKVPVRTRSDVDDGAGPPTQGAAVGDERDVHTK